MNLFKKIQGGIYHGVGMVLVFGLVGISYAAYEAMVDVNAGDTLTDTVFNKVLENQRVFRTEIDNINASTGFTPSGAVMAFNLTTCPTGWSKANGTANALDLRGEFIRGWADDGSVDSGRGLASSQADNFQGHLHEMKGLGGVAGGTALVMDSNGVGGSTQNPITDGLNGEPRTGTETRPRNVALLYCVKD